MKRYSVLKTGWYGIWSRAFYQKVVAQWGVGQAISALILAAILGGVSIFKIMEELVPEVPHLIRQIPPMQVKDGELFVHAEQPVIIYKRSGGIFAIIDATESELLDPDCQAIFKFTKRWLLVRQSKGQYTYYAFKEFGDFSINKEKISPWTKMLQLGVILSPLLGIMFIIPFFAVSSCILALVPFLLSRLTKLHMTYGIAFNYTCALFLGWAALGGLVEMVLASGIPSSVSWIGMLLSTIWVTIPLKSEVA